MRKKRSYLPRKKYLQITVEVLDLMTAFRKTNPNGNWEAFWAEVNLVKLQPTESIWTGFTTNGAWCTKATQTVKVKI